MINMNIVTREFKNNIAIKSKNSGRTASGLPSTARTSRGFSLTRSVSTYNNLTTTFTQGYFRWGLEDNGIQVQGIACSGKETPCPTALLPPSPPTVPFPVLVSPVPTAPVAVWPTGRPTPPRLPPTLPATGRAGGRPVAGPRDGAPAGVEGRGGRRQGRAVQRLWTRSGGA